MTKTKDKDTFTVVDISLDDEGELSIVNSEGRTLEAIKDTDKYTIFKDQREGGVLCILCKACGMVSYNSNDVTHRYCGNCKEFHRFRKSEREIIDSMVKVMKNHEKGLHRIPFIAKKINSCPKTVKKYYDKALKIIKEEI
jgi:hypothetical protein